MNRRLIVAALWVSITAPVSAEILTLYSDLGIPQNPPNQVIAYGCNITFPGACGAGGEGFNGNAVDLTPPQGYTSWKTTSTAATPSEYAGWGISYNQPQNLSRFWANGELRFWIYSTTPNIQLDIKQPGDVKVMPTITLSPPTNQWVYEHIKLNQFISAASSLASIQNPFLFTSVGGPSTFYIDDVRYVDSAVSPIFTMTLCNRSDNTCGISQFNWSGATAASSWALADQYLQLTVDPNVTSWGIQIYTDNTASNADPKFTGNTTTSNPAGLVNAGSTSVILPLAWNIMNVTSPTITAVDPNGTSATSSLWFFVKDRLTPAIGNNPAFTNGDPYGAVRNNYGIHYVQGAGIWNNPGEFGAANPSVPIYLESNFATAMAGTTYKTTALRVEFFTL